MESVDTGIEAVGNGNVFDANTCFPCRVTQPFNQKSTVNDGWIVRLIGVPLDQQRYCHLDVVQVVAKNTCVFIDLVNAWCEDNAVDGAVTFASTLVCGADGYVEGGDVFRDTYDVRIGAVAVHVLGNFTNITHDIRHQPSNNDRSQRSIV